MFDDNVAFTVAPVPTGVPPHDPVYQCHVAPDDNVPCTCNVVVPPEHTGEIPLAETGLLGIALTITCLFEQDELHVPFSART